MTKEQRAVLRGQNMTPSELQQALLEFTGTIAYHRWSPLFRNFVLTDGVNFLAEAAGAYWLCDMIASHLGSYRNEGFVVVTLKPYKAKWMMEMTDGNDKTLCHQLIQYSDFPLDEITLYVIPQDDLWVILLTSEY